MKACSNKVLVVGAGIAGVLATQALIKSGISVTLFDGMPMPAMQASGNPAGAFHIHVTKEDIQLSKLSRIGVKKTLSSLRELTVKNLLVDGIDWNECGQLQLAVDEKRADRMKKILSEHRFLEGEVKWLDRIDIKDKFGISNSFGGYLFAEAGWVSPRSWINAILMHAYPFISWLPNKKIFSLHEVLDDYQAIVLACGYDAFSILERSGFNFVGRPVNRVKGQVSVLSPEVNIPIKPRVVVSGLAYGIPLPGGEQLIGATYEHEDIELSVTDKNHYSNLSKWLSLWNLHDQAHHYLSWVKSGRSAFRVVTPDRAPVIGEMPLSLSQDASIAGYKDKRLFVVSGFGSKGLTWAALAGDVIASLYLKQSHELSDDLAKAIDPRRFL